MRKIATTLMPAWLKRGLADSRALLRYGVRFLRFRHAHNRSFGRHTLQASWRRPAPPAFIAFAEADFQLKSLLTNHCGSGHCRLPDTPLYEFVRSHVHGIGSKEPYRRHLEQRFEYGAKQINERIATFENLIDLYMTENLPLTGVVKLRSTDEAELVDGAHRATIVHAVGKEDVIRCSVIYRTLKGGR